MTLFAVAAVSATACYRPYYRPYDRDDRAFREDQRRHEEERIRHDEERHEYPR